MIAYDFGICCRVLLDIFVEAKLIFSETVIKLGEDSGRYYKACCEFAIHFSSELPLAQRLRGLSFLISFSCRQFNRLVLKSNRAIT